MEPSSKILETERLILREFDGSDAEFILELLNSPTWLKYIGNKNVDSVNEAGKYIENVLIKSYEDNGFGFWKVELKSNNLPIGLCGLIKRETLDDVDIGFAFLPEFAGKGFGFEIAKATLEFAKDKIGLKRVVAITLENNIASIKLLKKIGLKYEKIIDDAGSNNEELMLFGVNF